MWSVCSSVFWALKPHQFNHSMTWFPSSFLLGFQIHFINCAGKLKNRRERRKTIRTDARRMMNGLRDVFIFNYDSTIRSFLWQRNKQKEKKFIWRRNETFIDDIYEIVQWTDGMYTFLWYQSGLFQELRWPLFQECVSVRIYLYFVEKRTMTKYIFCWLCVNELWVWAWNWFYSRYTYENITFSPRIYNHFYGTQEAIECILLNFFLLYQHRF